MTHRDRASFTAESPAQCLSSCGSQPAAENSACRNRLGWRQLDEFYRQPFCPLHFFSGYASFRPVNINFGFEVCPWLSGKENLRSKRQTTCPVLEKVNQVETSDSRQKNTKKSTFEEFHHVWKCVFHFSLTAHWHQCSSETCSPHAHYIELLTQPPSISHYATVTSLFPLRLITDMSDAKVVRLNDLNELRTSQICAWNLSCETNWIKCSWKLRNNWSHLCFHLHFNELSSTDCEIHPPVWFKSHCLLRKWTNKWLNLA